MGYHGVGELPGALELPVQPVRLSPTRANGLGTATINLTPQNTQRYPAVKTLDLNFDKTIRLGGARRVDLNAAIFNISNTNTTLRCAGT